MKPDLTKEVFESQFEPDGTPPIVGDMIVNEPSTNYLLGEPELEKWKWFHPFRIDHIDDKKCYCDERKIYIDVEHFNSSCKY